MINVKGNKIICLENAQKALEFDNTNKAVCYSCAKNCFFWRDSEGYITHRFKGDDEDDMQASSKKGF